MAYPVEFPEVNARLGKPKTMTDAECGTLPVYHDGRQCISCWRFTPEEMEVILKTHCVFVSQLRPLDDQAPIWVEGAAPVKEDEVKIVTVPETS